MAAVERDRGTTPTLRLELTLPDESVISVATATLPLTLSKLEVHYRDSPSDDKDFVQVLGHENKPGTNWNDINKGFGGKYVYLKPVWTTNIEDAFQDIGVYICPDSISQGSDLAKGAGGDYRYVMPEQKCIRGAVPYTPITEVILWEDTMGGASRPDGFDLKTRDINEGRGKRKLVLLCKVTEIKE